MDFLKPIDTANAIFMLIGLPFTKTSSNLHKIKQMIVPFLDLPKACVEVLEIELQIYADCHL